ncbi:TadE/TadG family type IV pilus assembly protein [Nesterenkonia sp. NBAIMH1]|uniref:TadE/TadG family type IV pilus assembly protein n=1 Tax=Nesterenkonia sp. NBAIMH1 TaxID=2600320 RepID=UPI0011B3B04C|nr:TadE/TadG family type IV pilus assembly protein [Nesterenkonia sp. NBAIMH1]
MQASVRLRDEEGSAPVEFTMMASLVVIVVLAVVHLGLALHVRNTMIDAASTGARFGALADRTPEDGAERARDLLGSSVASQFVHGVTSESLLTPQGEILRVRVAVEVPLISWAVDAEEWEVVASARIIEP